MTKSLFVALALLVGLSVPAFATVLEGAPLSTQNVGNDIYPGQDDPNPLRPPEDSDE